MDWKINYATKFLFRCLKVKKMCSTSLSIQFANHKIREGGMLLVIQIISVHLVWYFFSLKHHYRQSAVSLSRIYRANLMNPSFRCVIQWSSGVWLCFDNNQNFAWPRVKKSLVKKAQENAKLFCFVTEFSSLRKLSFLCVYFWQYCSSLKVAHLFQIKFFLIKNYFAR